MALISFVKKKDGRLRLCVDNWALNTTLVKNRYPLQQFSEMLNRTPGMPITKSAWRKATSTKWRYRQFQHRVMPFALTNTPATILPFYNSNWRKYVVGRATTFKRRDDPTEISILIYNDPTGGARMMDQSALNDSKLQRDPESGDKHTQQRIKIRT